MRSVSEWIGKTDDTPPPPRVKDRIRDRQGNICALSGLPLGSDDVVQYDHIVPLWLGGRNSESNLQAVTSESHKRKTAAEAKVRAKCNRTRKKHLGIAKAKSSLSHPRFKRCMDGTVVDRRTGEVIR
ncbi:HNH endonuclease signature motif containing protein [Ensifer sp. Root278]|uniref:HNH endonuclease n=1 Tax=Ensifer sp. Root278 TaxID=1736509 RepID=UPI00071009B1|nr:HNH endonuclease signature motif containing protein [Ensifer sp. Root278]KRD56526.1 HNH endonuclease [Ensifer sp. Root278]